MENNELENHSLQRESNGKLLKTILNLVNCFYIDENLKDLFIYNEFSRTIEYSKDAIWHGVKKGQELRDKDIIFVQYYLAHNKSFEMTPQKILNALIEISERNKYNPIKNYLEGLSWDGYPRLNKWLVNTGKTDDNHYIEAIGSKYLMGAVARIYEPGIKFDNVLVLEGPENMGKSTVFRVLSEPWFCDSIDLMQSDEKIIEKMRGYWILEVAELFGMRDDNQERIKSFLTRQEDVQRLPYDKLTGTFPRQSVFCGSSNKMSYLFGEEGNRRFWPVKFESIDIQWLRDNKDQLFAEAVRRYKDGEKLYLDPELYEYAKRVQSQKLSVNEVWLDIIEIFLVGKNETTMQEILETCLKIDIRDLNNRSYAINAGRILKRLGFEKKDLSLKSGNRYIYVRENELALKEKQRLFIEEE